MTTKAINSTTKSASAPKADTRARTRQAESSPPSAQPGSTFASAPAAIDAERARLIQADSGAQAWRQWGPYLSDRQWGTVREDYSPSGDCWSSFPHDHARSRAYRWGEDGLLGICDDDGRLNLAVALWNGNDPILKERLFGLTGPEGNHGEDVKEHYFHLDATPTGSYLKALYKYPQRSFPYARLVDENRRRSREEPEFELVDTGAFDDSRYFDVPVEYAKAAPEDILVRITISNRGPSPAVIHALPTLWFRNTWSWGDAVASKPELALQSTSCIVARDPKLGVYHLSIDAPRSAEGLSNSAAPAEVLFTENETNAMRLWNIPSATPFVKDAFHERVIQGRTDAVNPEKRGTKAAAWHTLTIGAKSSTTLRLRLTRCDAPSRQPFGEAFDAVFQQRIAEADAFYAASFAPDLGEEECRIARQSAAGLLWSKQFYHYDVAPWLDGDPGQIRPPEARKLGRNNEWRHLNNRDIISMPDKWEYPWYAAWDLAFQMLPMAQLDPQFAKDQLVLMLREWYMHPSGQIPAYEFAFGDVNPPVHAWACWRVYKMTGARGHRDRQFLARCFQKLVINFTWWVNRKDPSGKNLFAGGFLGLDNIGVFDRSKPLPTGGHLEQADGTAWMAFYCGTMLSMALELAAGENGHIDAAYEDMATKFFEHFIAITDSINTLGGSGLWDEADGFYYDRIRLPEMGEETLPLRVRSLVGMVPLLAVEVLDNDLIDRLPDFKRRLNWFLNHRRDLPWFQTCACAHAAHRTDSNPGSEPPAQHRLLAIPTRERLIRVVERLMDESEFLSPFGVRSISKFHAENPYVFRLADQEHRVDYTPGESTSSLFGGNSNWRGPIWFPLNFLLVEALERYHHFYGDDLRVEFPRGTGRTCSLAQAAAEIRVRLCKLFMPDASGQRPCHGEDRRFADDPHWQQLVYFYEHFHADSGRGLGASHQTGWTSLVNLMLGR
ncbi:MAG: glucosidase [Planctomycetota bacterium]|nr:glucosidase [Planctomycetota bacterium]